MAGSSALDGGRILKAGLLAFGTLMFAAQASAQPTRDPLAPLPTAPVAIPPAATPAPVQPAIPSGTPVPRDWRGVFDAIDAGDWASAQAGINALPPGILTPVAKAELYTAKGSPVVDLATLQSLIAEAPELPEANQLALMAQKRGATSPLLVVPEKDVYVLGSAPVRYRAHPVREPAADQLRPSIDSMVKADNASGAEALLVSQGPNLSVE